MRRLRTLSKKLCDTNNMTFLVYRDLFACKCGKRVMPSPKNTADLFAYFFQSVYTNKHAFSIYVCLARQSVIKDVLKQWWQCSDMHFNIAKGKRITFYREKVESFIHITLNGSSFRIHMSNMIDKALQMDDFIMRQCWKFRSIKLIRWNIIP